MNAAITILTWAFWGPYCVLTDGDWQYLKLVLHLHLVTLRVYVLQFTMLCSTAHAVITNNDGTNPINWIEVDHGPVEVSG